MSLEPPKTGEARSQRGRRTCLYCYHLFRVERGTAPCPACGIEQSKVEQDQHWSLEPRIRSWERWAKIGALLLSAGIAAGLARVTGTSSLPWAVGLVALVGWLLWYSAGCLTRRESFMNLSFLWPPLLLCLAFGPLCLTTMFAWIEGRGGFGDRLGSGLLWALPWSLPLGLSLWLPKRFARFRRERIAQGDSNATQEVP